MDRTSALAKAVAQTGALQLGFFTNNMGQPAPLYLDLSRLWQDPTMLTAVTGQLCAVIRGEMADNYDRIGGSDHSGLPLAALSAGHLGRPLIALRRTLGQDRRTPILGTMFPGDRILLIDDVIATGRKAMEMARIVKSEGGVPYGYCVLLDKQEGGSELLRRNNIKFACVATLIELARELHRFGWIDDAVFESLSDYVKSLGR